MRNSAMLKNRSLRLTALLAASLGLAPAALAAETPQRNKLYLFEAVDSFVITDPTHFEVTGILRGESAPRTLAFYISGYSDPGVYMARCDRFALLAMSKPGAWLLEVAQVDGSYTLPTCRLTRR
jgi:hypothetical protein